MRSRHLKQTILYIILLTGLFVCPVFFSDVLIEPTLLSRFTILSACLAIVAAISLIRLKDEIQFPKLLLVFISGFYLINIISVAWSINTAEAIFESQRVFLAISALLIATYIFQSKKRLSSFHLALVIFGWIALLLCIYDAFLLNKGYEESLFFGHQNLMSSFMLGLAALLFAGFYHLKGNWRYISFRTASLILLFLLFLTTRSVMLALLFSFILGAGIMLVRIPKRRKSFVFTYLGLAVIIGILLLFFPEIIPIVPDSLAERFALWSNTKQLIADNPVLGVGSGNWQFHYAQYGVQDLDKTKFYNIQFRRPHNDYLGIFSETGALGFSLFICCAILIFKKFSAHLTKYTDKIVIYLFCGTVALMIVSFFSFPKERIFHLVLFSILLAQLIAKIFPKKITLNRTMIGTILIIGLLFNAVIGGFRMSGEYHTKKSIQAQINLDGRTAINEGYAALNPFYITDPTGVPVYTYIGWGYDEMTMLDSLSYTTQMAYTLTPNNYMILGNYGYLLQRAYQFQAAREIYLKAYAINPHYETVLINLSALAYNSGDYEEAMSWLIQVKDYAKKYPSNLDRIEQHL